MTYIDSGAQVINRIDGLDAEFKTHLKIFEEHMRSQDEESLKLDNRLNEYEENLNQNVSVIHHIINTKTVIRDNTDYKDIKSIINLGDIVVLSEKKFSKFTRWLYKKLFGWVIVDYHWGDIIQTKIFNV